LVDAILVYNVVKEKYLVSVHMVRSSVKKRCLITLLIL
jgi:hypothetical protein